MARSFIDALLSRRLLLVTGKGGTGKSTCAAALALLAARRGHRPLLVEVECSSSARGIFGIKKPALLPKRGNGGVDVASIDFQRGVEEVVHDVMRVPRVVRVMLRHPIISRFLRAAPSVLDFVALYMTTRFVNATDSRGAPEHDLVVLDLPAFGHAKIMLDVGRTSRDMFKMGPIAARATEIDRLVRDRDRTAVVVVTLPEEMPITETIEGCTALRENLGLPLGPVVVNGTQQQHLDDDEAALVERMASAAESSGDEAAARALRRAATWSRWAELRRSRVDRLRRELDGQIMVEVPLFAGAIAGMELTRNVADALASATPEVLGAAL